MMDNNKTVTMKMSAPIVTPDGEYELSFRVSVRSGVTDGMIEETVAHWLHAAQRLANGELGCTDEFQERSEYELSEHGQNRIVIFGDMQVFTKSGLRLFPVNVFCETTSAQGFVAFTWVVMEGLGRIAQLDKGVKFNGAIKQQKPKSELDNHFGERKPEAQTPQEPATAQSTAHQATNPAGDVIDLDYDYKLRSQYEKDFVGCTVRVRVSKVQWCAEAKKDKSGTYEIIHLFKEAYHENPIYDLSIWPPKPDDTYGDGKTLMRSLPPGSLEKPGDFIQGSIHVYYKLKTSDKHPGRVFWNVVHVDADISLASVEEPPGQEQEQLEKPPIDYDDVPF